MRSRSCCKSGQRKTSRLLVDTIREILHTKKRFLSLFVMSLLAVGFLSGLRMTAPDMHNTLDRYYDRQHFMDVRLVSMLGLTEDDLQAVSQLQGVSSAEGSRSFDALLGEDSVTVFQIPEKLNLLDLEEGRLPESPDECVTEIKILESTRKKIGDTITIDTRESFDSILEDDPLAGSSAHSTKHTYTIVGIARSPLYVSRTRAGSTVGSGSVNGFVALPRECFTQEVYSTIYLELEGLSKYNCYTDDAYIDAVDAFIEEMKPFAKERAAIRKEKVSEQVTFSDMMAALIAGIAESGSSTSGALSGLQVADGEWYILSRKTIRSYVEFSSDAERMGKLADVFPLIFFLVAALSSLTSMTRMVEDHRAEIGTLKALGFSTLSISIKYIGYALVASLVGGGAGLLAGCIALPSLIYFEWGILYLLPPLEISVSPFVALYSLGSAVLATAGAAFAACCATLLSKPAELLRPRAPKPGKRVLLEHVGAVWKRLSFIQKVSVRNLFRYKKRFWMTIIGIAGCTALLATGYGLRDSIYDVLTWQFDEVMPYSASISITEGLTPSDRAELMEALEAEPGIASFAGCYERSVGVRTAEGTVDNVTLQASPEWRAARAGTEAEQGGDYFDNYINLRPGANGLLRYGKVEELPRRSPTEDTVVIDEKLGMRLGVSAGDTIMLLDSEEKEYPVVVGAVCENYVLHHVYMTSSCYKKVFGVRPANNLLLVKLTDPGRRASGEGTTGAGAESANGAGTDLIDPATGLDLHQEAVASRVLKLKGVLTFNRIDETRDHFEDSFKSLDAVVWIIILAAAALAFLVLFNLTNINVTERIRELATLKVLGFFDTETASYVYRENIVLTVLGAALGMFMGTWLHRWLIGTIEMEYMIFGHGLHAKSYLYAALLTAVFALSVNFFSFFAIRKINMVESLKSVE